MDTENSINRPTGLRPPSRLPTSFSLSTNGQALHELDRSQSNVRSAMAPPTAATGMKRGVPPPATQSAPKRKPLYQRAGEYPETRIAGSGSQHTRANSIKELTRSNTNYGGPRQTSNSSYTSSSSFSSTVGPGSRPPSRSHTRARSATRTGRPATAMGNREEGQGNNVHEIDEKVLRMENEFLKVKEFMESTEKNSVTVKEELDMAKIRSANLEKERDDLRSEKLRLMDQLADAERKARNLKFDLQEEQRRHERHCENLDADHKRLFDAQADEFKREMTKLDKLQQEFEEKCGAETEARLESLSQENREFRHTLEKQKRDNEHEIKLLNEDIERRGKQLSDVEEKLRKALHDQDGLNSQIKANAETIDRLRKRAEDAEDSLKKDKGHLGGQISYLSASLDLKSETIQSLEEKLKALEAKCEQEVANVKHAAEKEIAHRLDETTKKLIKEEERRHKLFEQVQELKGNIRVMCRIKPPSEREKDALIQFNPRFSELDEDKIDGVSIPTEREDFREPGKMIPGKPKDFSFERVFDDGCTNRDVFDEISQLVQSVMDGKKVCIFCYGQTGSGKTYTMSKRQGDDDDGIIPRTQAMIFREVERLKGLGWEYSVEGSYLEVYQDKLYDLLASRHSKPEPLMVDPISEELNIKGHDFTLLNEERDLDEMVKTADNNRHVAATAKNDRSSRSHSILVLKISGTKRNEDGEIIKTRKGTLNLIDLAGSETPDKNGPPQVYKEGVEINSSLSYLRTVLSNLGQGKTEGVDFRSYTLTQLLRPSLGKGCRTLMFVMVSPLKDNESETVRSLEFAKDAQKVKMGGNGSGGKSKK
ncbi:P-loop containing nucleoside triphosphate hydrolase protein [Xylariomycetidae sp. FL2044]|nr:P-loop containing nucleoside triphosphate hydrolase protein [Xylariomycetidae sp. FL2044]